MVPLYKTPPLQHSMCQVRALLLKRDYVRLIFASYHRKPCKGFQKNNRIYRAEEEQ